MERKGPEQPMAMEGPGTVNTFAELERMAAEDAKRTVREYHGEGDSRVEICTLDGSTCIVTPGGIRYNCLSLGDARALANVIVGEWAKGNHEIEDHPGIARRDPYSCEYRSTWNLLSQYRTMAKMSQEDLSRASGVTKSQIHRIEHGEIKSTNISAKTLIALAGALGVHPIELVDIKQA